MASEKEAALAAVPSDSPIIFDKIIKKEIPSTIVFEDDKRHISASSYSHSDYPQKQGWVEWTLKGDLPEEYFKNWDAMKTLNVDWLAYMQANITFQFQQWGWDDSYLYSMTITNKGVRLVYVKIPNIFTAVDLSSNKFNGQIPESIASLKGLQLLNLSNNDLVGSIPQSFGNLSELESLDLSRNRLTGEIPRHLQLLAFLAFFNVSFNRLSGPMPRGKQFDTFQNNSYEGNLGLCGDPLSMKCGGDPEVPPPVTTEEDGEAARFPNGVDWVVICMGYGSGLIVGFIIGHRLIKRRLKWVVDIFRRREGSR